jgi:flagellar hook-basal body protein
MSYIGSVFSNLQSLQTYSEGVNSTSDNLSHINTPGYKESELNFSDLVGSNGGQETRLIVNESQGRIELTNRDLQAAIDGNGYFLLKGPDGQYYATRNGQFALSDKGVLVLNGTDLVVQTDGGSFSGGANINENNIMASTVTSNVSIAGAIDSTVAIGDQYVATGSNLTKIIDKQGNEYEVNFIFKRDSVSSWSLLVTDKNNNPIANYSDIEFDADGALINSKHDFSLSYTPYEVSELEGVSEFSQDLSDLTDLSLSVAMAPDDSGTDSFIVEGSGAVQQLDTLQLGINGDDFFVNENGDKILFNVDGNLQGLSAESFRQKDSISSGNIYIGGDLDSSAAVGEVVTLNNASQTFVDSEGNVHSFEVEYKKTDVDEWSMTLRGADGEELTSSRTITFLSDGTLSPFSRSFSFEFSGQTLQVSMNDSEHDSLKHGAESNVEVLEVDGKEASIITKVDLSETGELLFTYANGEEVVGPALASVTSLTSEAMEVNLVLNKEGNDSLSSVNTTEDLGLRVSQDGESTGIRQGVTFDNEGSIVIHYSNGKTETVGQLSVVDVRNLNSAERIGEAFKIGDSDYSVINPESGEYRVINGGIEGSNVDVTEEFSELMVFQRGYQASSQAMTVANEMVEELYKSLSR